MEFTPNEWLLDFMVPGSGQEKLIMKFLDVFERRDDALLVRHVSPFTQKLYGLSKQHCHNPRNLFRRFCSLMRDPKVRIVYEHELIPIHVDLQQACPRKDLYLVELAAVSEDKLIITTDRRFHASVNGQHGFTLVFADEFLQEYCEDR